MKILMTTDNIGGVWTYATNLAVGLQKHGIETALAVIGEPLTAAQRKELNSIEYYHYEAKQEWMPDPWQDVRKAGKWLLGLSQALRPDLVHINSYSIGSLNWKVPLVVTLHSCVLTWWEAVHKEKAPDEWNEYREKVMEGIRAADLVVAPGNAMMNQAEKHYGPFRNKLIINNGRDGLLFRPDEKKEDFVFTMGRLWDRAKNAGTVIDAASKINYPVYIAGDYGSLPLYKLPGNIKLLGHLSNLQVAEFLARARVYLLPALYEPFGYSFLEAAFCRCALVGGNISSLREIWNDAMLYVDGDKPDEIAILVNELMEDKERTEDLGNKALARAKEKYSLDTMIGYYKDMYLKTVAPQMENSRDGAGTSFMARRVKGHRSYPFHVNKKSAE